MRECWGRVGCVWCAIKVGDGGKCVNGEGGSCGDVEDKEWVGRRT